MYMNDTETQNYQESINLKYAKKHVSLLSKRKENKKELKSYEKSLGVLFNNNGHKKMDKIKGSKPIWNEQEKMLFSAKVLEYGIDLKRLVKDIPTKSTQNVRNRINYLKKIKFPSAAELPIMKIINYHQF